MKLNAQKFGLACAITVALLWVVCSIFVMMMPSGMMSMSGYMLHMDSTAIQAGVGHWNTGMHGLFFGLIAWTIIAGLSGWLLASVYNKLV